MQFYYFVISADPFFGLQLGPIFNIHWQNGLFFKRPTANRLKLLDNSFYLFGLKTGFARSLQCSPPVHWQPNKAIKSVG